MDETWVNKNTTRKKGWRKQRGKAERDDADGAPEHLRQGGKAPPTGKGGRAIVIGIGSRQTGIVKEHLKVFRGIKSKVTDDYHKEMNAKVFEEWLEEVLKWIQTQYVFSSCCCVSDHVRDCDVLKSCPVA